MRLNDRVISLVAVVGISVCYAVFGLLVLAPEGLYSGDIGVKFVQARALAASEFRSLDIPYLGEFLDPSREFFPIRPPFVMTLEPRRRRSSRQWWPRCRRAWRRSPGCGAW